VLYGDYISVVVIFLFFFFSFFWAEPGCYCFLTVLSLSLDLHLMTLSETIDNERGGAIEAVFHIYNGIRFKPPPKQFTVLAAFYLVKHPLQFLDHCDAPHPPKIISLSTGTKCVPAIKYSPHGELVHDSHAEALARRGAARWLLEEIGRICDSREYISDWLTYTDTTSSVNSDQPRYKLRDGVQLNMYISTLPCVSRSSFSRA
jgi:tRNA-specific adenosine deaminase 1